MKTRIITGVLTAIFGISLVIWGPDYLMMAFVLALATLAYVEFDRLFFGDKDYIRRFRMSALLLFTIFAFWQNQAVGGAVLWINLVFLCVWHVFQASRQDDLTGEIRNFALEGMAQLYLLGMFAFLLPIADLAEGRAYVLLLFFIVFIGDTAAYFVGIKFGKNKLAVRLSPKKSVEGAIGGLVFSMIAAGLWILFMSGRASDSTYVLKVMSFTPLASILAQAGDLLESLFKRSQSQKDSGTLLPGHGGILDRLDGLALVSPIYYLFLVWVLGV